MHLFMLIPPSLNGFSSSVTMNRYFLSGLSADEDLENVGTHPRVLAWLF